MPMVLYASGRSGGSAAAIGIGRVTSSLVVRNDEMPPGLSSQGVLSPSQIVERAKGGKVHVLTFDNYQPFIHAVGVSHLRQIGSVAKINFQTVTVVDGKDLQEICRIGMYNEQ
jgi:hypothetical protein